MIIRSYDICDILFLATQRAQPFQRMAQHAADALALCRGRLSCRLLLWTFFRLGSVALCTLLSVVLCIAVLRIATLVLLATMPAVVAFAFLSLTLLAATVSAIACLVVAFVAVATVVIAAVGVAAVRVAVVAVALVEGLLVVCSAVGHRVLLIGLHLRIVSVATLPAVVTTAVALFALCALLVLCIAVGTLGVFVCSMIPVFASTALRRSLAIAF